MINEKDNYGSSIEGKYVDDRGSVTKFFHAFLGKFWRLIGANFIFIIFSIPSLIISFMLCSYVVDLLPISLDASEDTLMLLLVVGFPIMMFLMAVPLITVGPVQAGLTYVLKCYNYGTPTLFWYDFRTKAKENFKQSLIVSLINFAAIAFLFVELYLYKQIASTVGNSMMLIAYVVLFSVLIIVLMMAMYIYPMMVSYELSTKNIYKNAFLLSIGNFLPNLIILIVLFILIISPIIIVILTESYLALAFVYLYYSLLGFTLPGLVLNALINPIIDKHIMPKQAETENSTD